MALNFLLSQLRPPERDAVLNDCQEVPLEARATLYPAHGTAEYVWFPLSGVCSSLVETHDGAVEAGIVGREGMVGLPLFLGAKHNPFHVIVQVSGRAMRMHADDFTKHACHQNAPLHRPLLHYVNLYLSMVAQTAACNRLHNVEQRLSRWLLSVRDLEDSDEMVITQDFLAKMVGSYRPSITNALAVLEEHGAVSVARGKISIGDRRALEAASCECYAVVAEIRELLIGGNGRHGAAAPGSAHEEHQRHAE